MPHLGHKLLESDAFPFFAGLYSLVNGRKVIPHSHQFVEFVYVVDGHGIHTYKGLTHRIQAGDAFLIEPGIEHSYEVDGENGLNVYNILFQPSLFHREIEQLSSEMPYFRYFYVVPFMKQTIPDQPSLWLSSSDQAVLRQLLDNIVLEYTRKEPGYRSMIRSKLVECFVFLSRCYQRMSTHFFVTDNGQNQTMEKIAIFIENNCEKPFTLQEVCRLCGMSTSTFTAKFKEFTGRTFLEYRNEMRIQLAKRLLEQTDRKVTDIAANVGFDDVSLFNRTFRKFAGLPPSEYRKSFRHA